jgi:hypothetical protein
MAYCVYIRAIVTYNPISEEINRRDLWIEKQSIPLHGQVSSLAYIKRHRHVGPTHQRCIVFYLFKSRVYKETQTCWSNTPEVSCVLYF